MPRRLRTAALLAAALAATLLASGCATDRGQWYTGVEGGLFKS